MEIYIGKKKLSNHDTLSVKEAKKVFRIKTIHDDFIYSVIIYDIYAPSVENPINSPYLHYLKVNINGDHDQNGKIISNYKPPSPPPNSGNHKYIIDIYVQKNTIKMDAIANRPKFNLESFVLKNNLKLFERFDFYVTS